MTTPLPTAGSVQFAAFLRKQGVSDGAAAEALGTNEISVYQWRTGRARPRDVFKEKIARWTHGLVNPPLWLTDEERAKTAAVAPLEPLKTAEQG
jgi:hypothetical protein